MLSYIEFNSSYTEARPPIIHTSLYLEYVLVGHRGWSHAERCMYRVVCFYKLL